MGFVKNLAKGGLFGLTGLAASGALDKKKKSPSLISAPQPRAIDTTGMSTPSLISKGSY